MITTFTYSPEGSDETGKPCTFANINGKTYQIIRGYELDYKKIWLHVAGTTALRQTDLGKQWEVRGSKGIYIACVSRYFNYQSARADLRLSFIGNTTAGSRFLALWFISRRYGLGYAEDRLGDLAQIESPCWDSYRYGTQYLDYLVSENQNTRAVHVDFQLLDCKEIAAEMIEDIMKQNGKKEVDRHD